MSFKWIPILDPGLLHKDTIFLEFSDHRCGHFIAIGGFFFIQYAAMVKKSCQQPCLRPKIFMKRIFQKCFALLFGHDKPKPDLFFLCNLLLHRKYGLQCLVHGRTITLLHPCRHGNELGFRAHAAFHDSVKFLDLFRRIIRCIRKTHHIAFHGPVAVSKWKLNLHSCFQMFFQMFRYPVLKHPVQFLVGNIHDHIGVFHLFL